jgi:hypothetical protein
VRVRGEAWCRGEGLGPIYRRRTAVRGQDFSGEGGGVAGGLGLLLEARPVRAASSTRWVTLLQVNSCREEVDRT